MSKRCQKAFEKGKAKRALYPLEPSTYKLQEAHLGWQRQYDTLKLLESALDNRTEMPADYLLGCWTGADWRGELERLPQNLASDMGWRVLKGSDRCASMPVQRRNRQTSRWGRKACI